MTKLQSLVEMIDRYLDELEWRFNNRNSPHIFRDTLEWIVRTPGFEYRELVKGKRAA